MAVAALILTGVFALLDVARHVIQRRSTGDAGIRQFSVGPGSLQWWAHWGMEFGTLITGVAAPIADLTGLAPLEVLDHPVARGVGTALAVLGILATFAAQLAMGASWRIGVDETERTVLVTWGPFRLVRNPIFSAVFLAFLGLTLMVPNVVAVAGFAAILVGTQMQVRRVEEPYLRRTHGTAYTDYASRVGRFLPGIGRLRSDQRNER
ncbi:isoprenylcysteine carboxylmethyltransferase family protein [Pseudarthrobacter sp. NIBRBAC000502771]|uniref:methyltransferase family protein n=1 Tax=Pseudarthrobacter sp. NIBRBAC000502771 TaxID=2590774 RepID=UPI0011310B4B|nr:isoprenylcysteine carboxylmethyltransferase family protein [Pseudarthrobacter sp. NIBRBAC000502771]QDG63794.1 isoprenylcysteine carboxylmethyltransferase family protein [Pseudarthrobacter sp. NIBRBAC000502771]